METSLTAKEVRDGIKKHIDANDDVVVVTVTGESWATHGLSSELNEWLKKSL